ncbi:hypothetical protein ABZ858_07555 [Streptomyces sp. NPDC047017]
MEQMEQMEQMERMERMDHVERYGGRGADMIRTADRRFQVIQHT